MSDYPPELLNFYMRYFSEWMRAPSNLLETVAMVESSYNPEAGSFNNVCNPRTNACGLMQLKPIALEEARRMGYNLDPLNPVHAIIGAVILFYKNDQYMRRYVQNITWPIRLVAYNGGWTAGVKFAQTGVIPSRESANYLAVIGRRIGVA